MKRQELLTRSEAANSQLTTIQPHEHSNAPGNRFDSPNPEVSSPQPGDLILVERSGWYALKDGEMLRVCEWPGWVIRGRDIYVAPRNSVRTFWGPDFGAPDGKKPIHMSTSGGPFKTLTLSIVALVPVGTQFDNFWRWQDRPRAAGGVEYRREVTMWKLDWLPDVGAYLAPEQEARR